MAEAEPMKSGFYNMDCMEAMKQFPDGYFDLAIVDPPYGEGNSKIGGGARFGGWFDRYKKPIRGQNDLPKIYAGGGVSEQGEHGLKNTGKK